MSMTRTNFDRNGDLKPPKSKTLGVFKAPTRKLIPGDSVVVKIFKSAPGKTATWGKEKGTILKVTRPGSRLLVKLESKEEPVLCFWSKVQLADPNEAHRRALAQK